MKPSERLLSPDELASIGTLLIESFHPSGIDHEPIICYGKSEGLINVHGGREIHPENAIFRHESNMTLEPTLDERGRVAACLGKVRLYRALRDNAPLEALRNSRLGLLDGIRPGNGIITLDYDDESSPPRVESTVINSRGPLQRIFLTAAQDKLVALTRQSPELVRLILETRRSVHRAVPADEVLRWEEVEHALAERAALDRKVLQFPASPDSPSVA